MNIAPHRLSTFFTHPWTFEAAGMTDKVLVVNDKQVSFICTSNTSLVRLDMPVDAGSAQVCFPTHRGQVEQITVAKKAEWTTQRHKEFARFDPAFQACSVALLLCHHTAGRQGEPQPLRTILPCPLTSWTMCNLGPGATLKAYLNRGILACCPTCIPRREVPWTMPMPHRGGWGRIKRAVQPRMPCCCAAEANPSPPAQSKWARKRRWASRKGACCSAAAATAADEESARSTQEAPALARSGSLEPLGMGASFSGISPRQLLSGTRLSDTCSPLRVPRALRTTMLAVTLRAAAGSTAAAGAACRTAVMYAWRHPNEASAAQLVVCKPHAGERAHASLRSTRHAFGHRYDCRK
jgi:hypothetical protein